MKMETFEAYFDESENSATGTYVVGGFIGKIEQWKSLQSKWLASLPSGISLFHATDCFTGNNDFDGIALQERIGLLERLTDLIAEHQILLIGYGIDSKKYKKLAPKKKRNDFLLNKWAAPFGGAIDLACHAMGNLPGPTDWDILLHGDNWGKCTFYFESNEYAASAQLTLESMRTCPDLWFRNRIGGVKSGTKTGSGAIPLLQVADLGVFLVAKRISNAPDGKIRWSTLYEKLRSKGRVYRTCIADDYSLSKFYEIHCELHSEAVAGRNNSHDI